MWRGCGARGSDTKCKVTAANFAEFPIAAGGGGSTAIWCIRASARRRLFGRTLSDAPATLAHHRGIGTDLRRHAQIVGDEQHREVESLADPRRAIPAPASAPTQSSAETASSAISSSGSMASARAMQMRRRWPPENWVRIAVERVGVEPHRLHHIGRARASASLSRRLNAIGPSMIDFADGCALLPSSDRDPARSIPRYPGAGATCAPTWWRSLRPCRGRPGPPPGSIRWAMERATVDLPEPDSPTMPQRLAVFSPG